MSRAIYGVNYYDEKQRLSNKKDRFQHEWVFEANVSYEKTGLRWLVFVEGEGMYCLILTNVRVNKTNPTFSMRSFLELDEQQKVNDTILYSVLFNLPAS
ncbi:unnamed protein product [Porites evermanni]|uniref:Uncharacterized protein n=1 Tax=Porites evermanni TaxID=104178 RepID=A0ABN8MBK8_9CNID|nr:unnamed protein product [Porites evermanni]